MLSISPLWGTPTFIPCPTTFPETTKDWEKYTLRDTDKYNATILVDAKIQDSEWSGSWYLEAHHPSDLKSPNVPTLALERAEIGEGMAGRYLSCTYKVTSKVPANFTSQDDSVSFILGPNFLPSQKGNCAIATENGKAGVNCELN